MRVIFAFFLLIFCTNINSQNTTCSRYKLGAYKLIDSKLNINYKIERTKEHQIETESQTGLWIRFGIVWMSDCEYELSVIDGSHFEMINYFKGKKLIIRILETYPDGYKFESHIKGMYNYKSQIIRTY